MNIKKELTVRLEILKFKYILTGLTAFLISFYSISCSYNPATGERNLSLVSESQEIQIGKESDQQIVASMGLYPDDELQRYVESLGKQMASISERPNLPWTFRVIDDPIVNAFALPGGYIYVTRGILTHMTNEAELTAVLGHEIGHVTAKHSVSQMSKQQLAQLGLGVAMILKPEWQDYAGLASTGLGLLFLKFSRDDERQADELGLRYMSKINDDPKQMIEVMRMLSRVSQSASGGSAIPQWLSTHPDPENRIELINRKIQEVAGNVTNGEINHEAYMNRMNNLIYGDNPREGFFKGNTFYHPEMKFSFQFPQGWKTINQKQAVAAISPNEDAIIQITLAENNNLQQASTSFFSQEGLNSTNMQNFTVNGLQGIQGNFSAQTEQGALSGTAAFIQHEGNVFQILSYTGNQTWNSYNSPFQSSINSFNRVNDPNILNVQPMRIKVIKLESAMSLDEFNSKYPSSVPIENVAIINQVERNGRFNAGQLVKQVVGQKY